MTGTVLHEQNTYGAVFWWRQQRTHVCPLHNRLAMEEEGEDTAMDTQGDVWDNTTLKLE